MMASVKLLLGVLVTVGSAFKVLPTGWASYMMPVNCGLISTCLLALLLRDKACNVSMWELFSYDTTHVTIAMGALCLFEASYFADGFLHVGWLLLHLVVIIGRRQVRDCALLVSRSYSNVAWLRDVGFCSLDVVVYDLLLLLWCLLLMEEILLLHSCVRDQCWKWCWFCGKFKLITKRHLLHPILTYI